MTRAMTEDELARAAAALAEMAALLRAADPASAWAGRLASLAAARTLRAEDFRFQVRRLYGGMGSLNDIVPQSPEGRVDRAAAARFEALRVELLACVSAPGAAPRTAPDA